MSSRLAKRPTVICEINRNIGESILQLRDYAAHDADKDAIVEKSFCLLLMTLLFEGTEEALDGFERIQQHMDLADNFEREKLFGEFMTIVTIFRRTYGHLKYLAESLENILPSDLREFPETVFAIEWTRRGDVLKVS